MLCKAYASPPYKFDPCVFICDLILNLSENSITKPKKMISKNYKNSLIELTDFRIDSTD